MNALLLFGLLCTFARPWTIQDKSFELLAEDDFDSVLVGKPTDVRFVDGLEGYGAALVLPTSTIAYPPKAFATKAGRIEVDLAFPETLAQDHKFFTLLSDVGSGNSFAGAINVHWREKSNKLEFQIYDGKTHHTCISETTEWKSGKWYTLAFDYGPEGMSMEINGITESRNSYTGGLAPTTKNFGYKDAAVTPPPVILDNIMTYRKHVDSLDLNSTIYSPNGDGLNDSCLIKYSIADDSSVAFVLLDKSGKVVKDIHSRKDLDQGEYSYTWDDTGTPSGEYTLKMTVTAQGRKKEYSAPLIIDTRWKWQRATPTVDKIFPIGAWFFAESDASYIKAHIDDEAKAKQYYETSMADLKAHGINLIVANWTPVDHRNLMLDAANKNGIKVIVHLNEVNDFIAKGKMEQAYPLYESYSKLIETVKNHPAVIGYYIVDEPSNTAEETERIAYVKHMLESLDPQHPCFSCLLGKYEPTLKEVDYQALVIDIYPVRPGWEESWQEYKIDLDRGFKNAGERPLWVILQAFGKKGSWLTPTPEQIEAQVWMALAAGAKGVIYFIYQSTTDKQGEWLIGLVDMDMKPVDKRYDALKFLNAKLEKIAPIILTLKKANFSLPIFPANIIASRFQTEGGTKYLLLANKNTKEAVSMPWALGGTDVATGSKLGSRLDLRPGQGTLVKLPD